LKFVVTLNNYNKKESQRKGLLPETDEGLGAESKAIRDFTTFFQK